MIQRSPAFFGMSYLTGPGTCQAGQVTCRGGVAQTTSLTRSSVSEPQASRPASSQSGPISLDMSLQRTGPSVPSLNLPAPTSPTSRHSTERQHRRPRHRSDASPAAPGPVDVRNNTDIHAKVKSVSVRSVGDRLGRIGGRATRVLPTQIRTRPTFGARSCPEDTFLSAKCRPRTAHIRGFPHQRR